MSSQATTLLLFFNAMGLKSEPQFKKILGRLLDARLNGEVKTESEERKLAQQVI